MTDASIAGALPKGDANGIGPIIRELIDEPHRLHVVLAVVDCKKTVRDNDTGDVVPTARIRRLEIILRDDLSTAERLMRRSLESRTGRAVLPLDLEDEVRLAFRAIDPRTGESLDPGGDDG